MSDSEFIAYVGDPDIHDGRIAAVEKRNDEYVVDITTMTGNMIRIRLH